ncbi:MAG: alpha-L-fucosidase [Bacteroidota bacterium]|nr:alpha-L-fucosidase [Bacteroidota bacterium]
MKKHCFAILLCFSMLDLSNAQSYQPPPQNLEARQWFDSARFGMFIHWGASSVLGAGEWVMNNRNIRVEEYKRLLHFFNPVYFNAAEWVATAKAAGMKYITFITRHHDGFSNWDTKVSDWKITNTPYGKDVLKMLADECHKQGIKLFVYYSLVDWYRSDYPYETGRTGKGTGRAAKSDWNSYLHFMKTQLTELLTQYGEIAGVWFDGYWDQLANDEDKTQQPRIDWHCDEIYALIHRLQPQCLIGNNHHLSPLPGEDFQMFEKDLPGENKGGLSGQSVSALPLETCETINNSWGFNITDRSYKSTKELIHLLVRDAGLGANLLLNIGPMPSGEIQPEFSQRLHEVGQWMKTYGYTIYATKAGSVKPKDWGAVTEKGNKVFVHVLNKKEDKLLVQLPYTITNAVLLNNNKKVAMRSLDDHYYVFDLEGMDATAVDNIIELTVERS